MKLTIFDRKSKASNTYAMIRDDIYFNGLTIPLSEFSIHADKHIIVPLHAVSVVEWAKTNPIKEPFKETVNATKEADNPLLLIFNFKK